MGEKKYAHFEHFEHFEHFDLSEKGSHLF